MRSTCQSPMRRLRIASAGRHGDHHDWLSAGRGHVLERQQPASGRMKPQGREVVAGYEQTRGALHPRFLANRQRRHAKGQEPLERGHPLLDVAVLEPGGSDVRAVVGARLDGLKCRRRRDTSSGFHRTICSHENTTVFTPMPIASDTITTDDTSGIAASDRHACTMSCLMVGRGSIRPAMPSTIPRRHEFRRPGSGPQPRQSRRPSMLST